MKRLSAILLLLAASAATATSPAKPVVLECFGTVSVCSAGEYGEVRCGPNVPPSVPRSVLEVGENYAKQLDELTFLEFASCTRDARQVTCSEKAASGQTARMLTINRQTGRITYDSYVGDRALYRGACEVRTPVTKF